MRAGVVLLLLTVPLVPGDASGAPPPLTVVLAPISDEALHGCKARDLEKALRGGLARSKRFRFLPDAGDAHASLEILECSRAERQAEKVTATGGYGDVPGRRVGRTTDSEIVVETETIPFVALRARIVSGDRFMDVASGPKDRTLVEAADSLRRAIDEGLKTRGAWLVPDSIS